MNMAKRHRFLSDIADKQQMKPAGGTYWDARVLSVSRGAHDAPQSTRSLAAIPDQITHVSWSSTRFTGPSWSPSHQFVIRPKELGRRLLNVFPISNKFSIYASFRVRQCLPGLLLLLICAPRQR